MSEEPQPLEERVTELKKERTEEFEKRKSGYDTFLGMKPSEFDSIIQALKDIIARVDEMKEQGFSHAELEAQIVYEVVEDDLTSKRKSKRKERAQHIIEQTLTDLKDKGIDTSRLEEKWNIKKEKKKKGEVKARPLTSYQSCIKKSFEMKKRNPAFFEPIKEEISKREGIKRDLIKDFKAATQFCKEHHKDIEEFIASEASKSSFIE